MDDVELIRRSLERWVDLVDRRDLDGLAGYLEEFYAEDAWIDFGSRNLEHVQGQGVHVIIDWARDAFKEWGANSADFRYEFSDVFAAPGGQIVAVARSVGRMHGHVFETRFTYLFDVADGKISSMAIYGTPDEALEAAAGRQPDG